MPIKNLIEQKFGRLIITKQSGKDKNNHILWLCQCDCGKEKIISSTHLITGHTQSCGCLKNEGNNTKHNHAQNGKLSTIYKAWANMIQRCTNPHTKNYHNYGGRGITICKRWMKFENFLTDMGDTSKGYQIDRIDNNGHYHKSNCRWVTPKQNSRNRRNNRSVTHNRKTQCITAWAEEVGISEYVIYRRLNRGWSIKKALTTPVRQRRELQ